MLRKPLRCLLKKVLSLVAAVTLIRAGKVLAEVEKSETEDEKPELD